MERYLKTNYVIPDEWIEHYVNGLHLEFERADAENDKKALQDMVENGFFEFMFFHVAFTYGVFHYPNFSKCINAPYPTLTEIDKYMHDCRR